MDHFTFRTIKDTTATEASNSPVIFWGANEFLNVDQYIKYTFTTPRNTHTYGKVHQLQQGTIKDAHRGVEQRV